MAALMLVVLKLTCCVVPAEADSQVTVQSAYTYQFLGCRHVNQPQAIAGAFQRVWPVFRAIFSQ